MKGLQLLKTQINTQLKLSTRWVIVLSLISLPFLLLMVAGLAWLLKYDILWLWFLLSAGLSLLTLPLVREYNEEQLAEVADEIQPNKVWDERGQEAWKEVKAIATRVQSEDEYLDSWENLWDLLTETMEAVALKFHPTSQNSALETPVPYLLRVIELVAMDLRTLFSKNVPGSHILTINDVIRGQRLASLGKEFYNMYRIVSLGVTPHSALIREVRDFFNGKVMTSSTNEFKDWLLRAYVEKIGYYSIELYSGRIILDEIAFKQYTTKASTKSIQFALDREQRLDEEPLRILVLGQVNAGKSSLINALFGEMKALVDVLPLTSKIEPYLLEREGIQRAIIMDTKGYGDVERPFEPFNMARQEITHTDLILFVCSAATAARQADYRLLEDLRQFFKEEQRLVSPPIIVVLSYIDQLRPFREWQPPYNIARPTRQKEQMIRQAMEVTSQELKVELSQVVPVCLKHPPFYNVEEGLVPAILGVFSETERLKYLRCLKDYKNEDYWDKLREQSQNTGRLIVEEGLKMVRGVGKKIEEAKKNITKDHKKDPSA